MPYSELIKSFHRIRPYMRSFYVYGFRHRTDHDARSARSYDNERRRIESWLGDCLKFEQDAEGKRVFLSVDSRAIAENPLYRAFRAKSFTDRDIMLHFFLLDILDTEDGLALPDIMDELSDYLASSDEMLPEESSVRKKLKEYEELGLVRKEKQGRQMLYYRVPDTVDTASWQDALAFFSEAAPLGVIGSYMRQDSRSAFRFKHHYILNALDSEILCDLFLAMGEGKTVILQNERMTAEMLPLKIYISTRTGRQYVLGRTVQGIQFFRLDLLDSVKPGNPAEITAETEAELKAFQSKVWGASKKNVRKTEHLEFTVHAEPDEDFVVQRLQREKRVGTVIELPDGNWKFSADVFDARELLPWARTFIGRIVSLQSDNPLAEKRFYGDLAAMRRMYGGDEDGVL